MLNAAKDFILDILFPKHCVACGQADTLLCAECLARLEPSRGSRCHVCEKPVPGFFAHERCRRTSPLDGLFYIGWFSDPVLRSIIKAWKYEFIRELEAPIDTITAAFILTHASLFPKNALLVPIPLHPKRLAWRGFNQAEVLATIVGGELGQKVELLVHRAKNTIPQAELPKEDKKENVANAFSVVDVVKVFGRDIILVDDCFTTGATMSAAAAALKKAGARSVFGFVLARG